MNKDGHKGGKPRRQLTLFDSTCIIVGIIIGSGVYETSPTIAGMAPSASVLLLLWILGGAVALLGALCYAELSTMHPVEGGDYVYLTKAYGRGCGFLFVWCEFWIVRPGNVGAMAFVFGRYAQELSPSSTSRQTLYAIAAVAVLTLLNLLGVKTGKWVQNLLTTAKVLGLLAVVAATFVLLPSHASAAPPRTESANYFTAIVLIMFVYGGWNDMVFVAAEVRDPRRNMTRALLSGAAVVTVVYVLLNSAFLHALGLEGFSSSDTVAADVMRKSLGETGHRAISLLICVSSLGAINGMLLAGARIYYAVGLEHRPFSWLAKWNARFDSPVRSLLLQAVVVLTLVTLFGLYHDQGFIRIVIFTSVFFAFFFALTAGSVFVLRFKHPDVERPFRIPFYPVPPVLFLLACLCMLYGAVDYVVSMIRRDGFYNEGYLGILAVVTGLLLAAVEAWRRRDGKL